jgi:hypothetical protein
VSREQVGSAMPKLARRHHIARTSPKRQPFVGTCVLCGTPNLRMEDALRECPNQRGLTADEALMEAIDPKPHKAN